MIWSSNTAYAIGLMATDGNLSKDGRHINLTSKDLEQLENFNKALQLKVRITNKKGSFSPHSTYLQLQFSNKKLYDFMLKIGLTPNKSKSIGVLKIPNRFFFDFLRGHIDGDGSIIIYLDKYNFYKKVNYSNYRVMIYFISASYDHVMWLQSKIFQLTGLKGALNKKSSKNSRCDGIWVLKFSKKSSIKLLKLIYHSPTLISLTRKRVKVDEIFKYIKLEKRKTWTALNKIKG